MSLNQHDQLVIERNGKLMHIDLKYPNIEKRQLILLQEISSNDRATWIKWSREGRLFAAINSSTKKLYVWKLIEPIINKIKLVYESSLNNSLSFVNGQWMDGEILIILMERLLYIYRDRILTCCEFGIFIDFICMKNDNNNTILIYALDNYNNLNRIALEKDQQQNLKPVILETLDLGSKKRVTKILGICLDNIILLQEDSSLLLLVKIDPSIGHTKEVNSVKIPKGNQHLIHDNKIMIITNEELIFCTLDGEIKDKVKFISRGEFFSCDQTIIQIHDKLLYDEYVLFRTVKKSDSSTTSSKPSRIEILHDGIIKELLEDGISQLYLTSLYRELYELDKDKKYGINMEDSCTYPEGLERNVLTGLPLVAEAPLLECNRCNGKKYSEEFKEIKDSTLFWWTGKWYYNCPCGGLWRQLY